jgi:hypothetical protein
MRRNGLWCSIACLVLVGAVAVRPIAAQEASTDAWPGLRSSELQMVYVTDTSGRETTGRLLRIDRDTLVLLENGAERTFPMTDVRRIQKRDSLRNGVLIGAIVGGVLGVLSGGLADCPGDHSKSGCGAFRVAAVGVSTGVYAGLGAGIDALIPGRATLYAAPPRDTARVIGPSSGADRAQARFSIRW